jgi:hypothetical protein
MRTLKARVSMIIGSVKTGIMQITANEIVDVVKVTEKSVFVSKNGMTKQVAKTSFYEIN